jgi:copper resistance protein B
MLLAVLVVAATAAPAAEVVDHSAHAAPAADADHAAHSSGIVTPVPPLTDADRAAAPSHFSGHEHHDSAIHSYLLLDKLEYFHGDDAGLAWEAGGWLGTDLHRLWLRSDGARAGGEFAAADAELFFARSVATWWDVLAGARHDFRPGDDRTWAAIGLQGLAPQRFEVAATAYASSGGHTAARFEAEYQLLFTNRLMLQPVLDLWLYGKDDPAHGMASGFSTAEAGLRLRYEFTRRFAPYIGFGIERALGDTATLRRAAGTDVTATSVVAGIRTWF